MNFPKNGITEQQWWRISFLLLQRARINGQARAHHALTLVCAEEMWLTGSYL